MRRVVIIGSYDEAAERRLREIESNYDSDKIKVKTKQSLITDDAEYHSISLIGTRGIRADEVMVDSRIAVGDVYAYGLRIVQMDWSKVKLF
ncbi:hypothetical protein [Cytobacillus praedii]|uniref:Uncharacterized protein n=1 Tax=Cytobacillus praedii TaxID=1742358 RepID=A0A4R1AL89_9BACI|nr:hypothetical protein [Cytobacillus praedii]TCJ00425.1 hypothetical protein E0Y62_26895 [Cytobacillus praedii]